MQKLAISDYEFLEFKNGDARFIFSTSKNGLDFNIAAKEGIENLSNLKEWFDVKEVGYLSQVHSDLIYNYDGEVHKGDALITNRKNIAIGILTADCVPILLYDEVNKVASAVHSGWKGTIQKIACKTIEKMKQEYGTKSRDITAFIGPYIGQCCYEIGDEVINKFKMDELYKDMQIIENRKLDLGKCVIRQLESKGVLRENITHLNICTFCNKEIDLYSYRRDNVKCGRMFSFVIITK